MQIWRSQDRTCERDESCTSVQFSSPTRASSCLGNCKYIILANSVFQPQWTVRSINYSGYGLWRAEAPLTIGGQDWVIRWDILRYIFCGLSFVSAMQQRPWYSVSGMSASQDISISNLEKVIYDFWLTASSDNIISIGLVEVRDPEHGVAVWIFVPGMFASRVASRNTSFVKNAVIEFSYFRYWAAILAERIGLQYGKGKNSIHFVASVIFVKRHESILSLLQPLRIDNENRDQLVIYSISRLRFGAQVGEITISIRCNSHSATEWEYSRRVAGLDCFFFFKI